MFRTHRSRSLLTMLLTAGLLLAVTTASPAQAESRSYDLPLARGSISVHARDLATPEAVERLLLRIERAQGSDDIAFLDQAPDPVRKAVLETITRPSEPDVVAERTGTYGPAETAEILKSLGVARSSNVTTLASWTCGWGYKKVTYSPGLIDYYWFSLKTSFCWNGSTIQYTPTQQVLGDGSWGWSYTGCASCYVNGWPAPSAYLSYAQGRMNLGAGPASHNRWPWIQHIVDGGGWVTTTWHD
jgi:hypothetical protein